MDEDDPEKRIADLEHQLAEQKRIAELERQLAEAKAAAGRVDHGDAQPPPVSDPQAGQYAQALWDGLRSGGTPVPGGPSAPQMAQLREALEQAAAQAGMSQTQLNDALQRGHVTIKTTQSGSQSFSTPTNFGPPPSFPEQGTFTGQPFVGRQRPRRKFGGGALVGLIAGVMGACVGGAAALIAVFPSSALWMSGILCSSPAHLEYTTSHYSYKPGQSGTNVAFQCVSDTGTYDVNDFALGGLQALVIALVVGVGFLLWRLVTKPR